MAAITTQREFEEETGLKPTGPFVSLQPVKQKGGKIVHAWAFEGDCDPTTVCSNTFTMEWPPKSGQQMQFPEIDRAEFFRSSDGKYRALRDYVIMTGQYDPETGAVKRIGEKRGRHGF